MAGVLPGSTLQATVQALGAGELTHTTMPDSEQVFHFQGVDVGCRLGEARRIHSDRLDCAQGSLSRGDDQQRVQSVLGTPHEKFARDSEQVLVYELGGLRYDVVLAEQKVSRFEVSPDRLPPRNPPAAPYGVRTRGPLQMRLQLAVDGVNLDSPRDQVEKVMGQPTTVLGAVNAFGPTFVTYSDDQRVESVLGQKLWRDGQDWVVAGSDWTGCAKALAEIGQLHTQSPSFVSYNFRQFGEVRLAIGADQKVRAVELRSATSLPPE